jgi:hypothetical protein
MYTKDKATRITLRLNEDQFNFVKNSSDALGVSPSEFLRMVINLTMSTTKGVSEEIIAPAMDAYITNLAAQEGLGRENDKTDINNIV